MSLNFPPDNGSLFTFSLFYIVYFITLHKGTIRWLLFFGLMGTFDGLNKALFLINDLVTFILFVPVFFYGKVKKKSESIFIKENTKILFLSLLPLLVFLIIYSAWEYFVYTKFSAHYFLRGLITTGGKNYVYYTSANDSAFLVGNILFKLFYLVTSAVVMIKRLIEYADLQIFLLAPIFLGLFILSFAKVNFPTKRLVVVLLFSILLIIILVLIKINYLKVHEIFADAGEYILYTWTYKTYTKIFLFCEIISLFILNIKYSILRIAIPIIPYAIMLVILAKNSPFARLHTHVVAWSVILLAYIINWIFLNINKYSVLKRFWLGPVFLTLFIYFYIIPKTLNMAIQLHSGIAYNKNEVKYFQWVNSSLPNNVVILAGGKSDLVVLAENAKRPIVYNNLYTAALLIKPEEIPGVKPEDFGITGVRFLYQGRMRIPRIGANDFSITSELTNKDNFKRNKYIILEDDIDIWRSRVSSVEDSLFSTSSNTLHGNDYSIKVYKFNPTLKKAIYELSLRSISTN